jgi:hypothetical protein
MHFRNKAVQVRTLFHTLPVIFFPQALSIKLSDTEANQAIRQPSGFGHVNQ